MSLKHILHYTKLLSVFTFFGNTSYSAEVKVILMAGQSNMDGRAENVSVDSCYPLDSTLFYVGTEGNPVNQTYTFIQPNTSETSETGPEVALAQSLLKDFPKEQFAFIKYANGGTSLYQDWVAGGTNGTNGDGVEYVNFQTVVSSGLNALAQQNPTDTFKIIAVLWTQGERDALANRTTAEYESDLTNFISDIRLTYGDNIPFIYSCLSDGQTAISTTQINAIRDAQNNVNELVPDTYSIEANQFSVSSDDIHYDASGQTSQGLAYASRIGSILEEEIIDITPLNRGVGALDSRSGNGFLMYSEESVHTRFASSAPNQFNADHVIAVTYSNNQWSYDTNSILVPFTPSPTDLLLASVNFDQDTVVSLEGINDVENGIQKGYASGDLTYIANFWNNAFNDGEFGVNGTSFRPHFLASRLEIQAEDSSASSGVVEKTRQSCYTGSGYMDYGNNGTWLEWDNIEATAGLWNITMRYANGSNSSRTCNVSVNGVSQGNIVFPPTDSWSTWDNVQIDVNLEQLSVIRLESIGAGPNLDKIVIATN